jgi:hypothetical protein
VAQRKRKRSLDSPDWNDLLKQFPRGLHWRHDSVSATKGIIARLRRVYSVFGVLLDLDVDDTEDCEPQNVVVTKGMDTVLIALRFRKRIVFVGDRVAHTSHDLGVLHLADALLSEIRRALK